MRIEVNKELNGIELFFTVKPKQEIINTLKTNRWRWHANKKCWYNSLKFTTVEEAKKIAPGVIATPTDKTQKNSLTKYHKFIYDYITKDEFEKSLKEYYKDYRGTEEETNKFVDHLINTNLNISNFIRQAIIWKSIGNSADKFQCNGDGYIYSAIWHKLPTVTGLKKSAKIYAAIWGYDQTQITTATHYGKAFGLDVLITGGYGLPKVLLKRISKDNTFSDGCMYFTKNNYSDEEITETNTRALYFGR